MYLAFKLFNSVKHEHEARDLARLELQGLLSLLPGAGPLAPIVNFAEAAMCMPLRRFRKAKFLLPKPREGEAAEVRVLDCLLHELPYGRIQGYQVQLPRETDITRFLRRLGYTREIYVVTETCQPNRTLRLLFPKAVEHVNAQLAAVGDFVLYRFITHQNFLEKSDYISKLSRNEEEIDHNVDALFRFLTYMLYRIPASSTMRIGKRLLDYFTIREEPSLYLTHYMHPYKGKFHPKMARALLNYVLPADTGLVLDNFAGSGTLLVEAVLMGLDAYGVDINPLSALMTHVKCDSLRNINPAKLAKASRAYLETLRVKTQKLELSDKARLPVDQSAYGGRNPAEDKNLLTREETLKARFGSLLKNGNAIAIDEFLIARQLIDTVDDEHIRDFLLLVLSGSISDAFRRRKADFIEIFSQRLGRLCRRVYLFHKLNKVLQIEVGSATSFEGDTRDMRSLQVVKDVCRRGSREKTIMIESKSVDAIINSPPYNAALDYIKNDEPMLVILDLHTSLEQLKSVMMGHPRTKLDRGMLRREINGESERYRELPQVAKDAIQALLKEGRKSQALQSFRFFLDMKAALIEMKRVLVPGGRAAIIVGNNHYSVNGRSIVVRNDKVVEELAGLLSFRKDEPVGRELEKSSVGAVREESILLLLSEREE
jgi:DNA modification methylase